ncbi:MAG: universal stress protein [Nitrospirae bacterium]|nr:universal stress protein [Nitrospirota bacterium]
MRLLKVSVDVEDEDPVKAIIRVSREEEIDLMVLGHHEESKMERFLFGRNIDKLVDGAPCDVIVTRSHLYGKKLGAAKAA